MYAHESATPAAAARNKEALARSAKDKGKEVAPFLKQLRKMLDEELPEIMRWTADGRAFEIVDMEQMMRHVLPKYFKHSKYTSFQRQLNYFNFRKWTKSKATVCTFSNDYFVRDQPELSCRITRKKSLHASKPQLPPLRVAKRLDPIDGPHPSTHTDPVYNARQYWSKDEPVSISVPSPPADVYSHHSFPSPTDFDMMLKFHDSSMQQSTATAVDPASESLEWIDSLLPFVDRIDDEVYPFPYMPSFSGAYVSSSVSMPQRPYEYVSMAL